MLSGLTIKNENPFFHKILVKNEVFCIFAEISGNFFTFNFLNAFVAAFEINEKPWRNHNFITYAIHIWAYGNIVIICMCMELDIFTQLALSCLTR